MVVFLQFRFPPDDPSANVLEISIQITLYRCNISAIELFFFCAISKFVWWKPFFLHKESIAKISTMNYGHICNSVAYRWKVLPSVEFNKASIIPKKNRILCLCLLTFQNLYVLSGFYNSEFQLLDVCSWWCFVSDVNEAFNSSKFILTVFLMIH